VELLRDPDTELIAACRDPGSDGFEAAFEVLFQRYRERVYAIAFRVAGNQSDAMDIVQESFALLFRKLASFKGNSLFSTWLFRIVVNCSIDHRRRNKSQRVPVLIGDQDESIEVADIAPGPRDSAAVHEVGDQVQAAISQLSPKLRVILALRYLEEMSYEVLAVTLELSMGTVKSRLARAHLALENVVRSRFPHLDISRKLDAEDDASGAASSSFDASSPDGSSPEGDSFGGVG
jgi:RNA polymerase sigma-70 factor (ECF subfamily)